MVTLTQEKVNGMSAQELERALAQYQMVMAPVWANASRNAKVTLKGYMALHESLRRADR